MNEKSIPLTAEQKRVLQVLDFEPTLTCEIVHLVTKEPLCGERASWVFRCKLCRFAFVACSDHKSKMIAQSIRSQATGCPNCRHYERRLDDLMNVLPLRSAL